MPNYNRLIPREEAEEMGVNAIFGPEYQPGGAEAGPQLGSLYAISVNAGWREEWTGLMCKQPPYGGIRAIDLATGETLWDRPQGWHTHGFANGASNSTPPVPESSGCVNVCRQICNLSSANAKKR